MIRCPEYICECCAAMFLAVCYKAASEGPSVQILRWCRTLSMMVILSSWCQIFKWQSRSPRE